ncbi:putative adenylate-forming enzyme [Nitrospirillum viridazoti]|nr:putative adenylate-forming enzyme [Nitrospirillum amazonense]
MAQLEAEGGDTGHRGLSFGLSTGTTGEPGVFITSERDRARWLGSFLARVLPPALLLRGRAAILLCHDSQLYHQTGGRTTHISLSLGAEGCARALEEARPGIVVGPPSALRRIVEAGGFRRRFPVGLVVTGGEPLWPDDAALLADAFAAPVRQVYQAAEGFFAAACSYGRLHFNTDLVRVERSPIEGAPDRFVPIITDLVRDGPQRMVRYRTDDVAMEASGPCPCGSALPSVAGIEGRLADYPIDPQDRLLLPQDINAVLSPALAGSWFRVTQTDRGILALELPHAVPGPQAARAMRLLYELSGMAVTRRTLPSLPLTAKFRRTLRLSPPGTAPLLSRLQPPVMLSTTSRNAA